MVIGLNLSLAAPVQRWTAVVAGGSWRKRPASAERPLKSREKHVLFARFGLRPISSNRDVSRRPFP
jgi:hypothetical protein